MTENRWSVDALCAVLNIVVIGKPRTGKFTPAGALLSLAFLFVAYMAVSS